MKDFLCRDPLRRLGVRGSIQQIREHPFFENLDWEKLVKCQLIPPWMPKQTSRQGSTVNQLVGKKVNEEDLETMSTLYFDKVFTRLPVQSEASISPNSPQHQQGNNYMMMKNNKLVDQIIQIVLYVAQLFGIIYPSKEFVIQSYTQNVRIVRLTP